MVRNIYTLPQYYYRISSSVLLKGIKLRNIDFQIESHCYYFRLNRGVINFCHVQTRTAIAESLYLFSVEIKQTLTTKLKLSTSVIYNVTYRPFRAFLFLFSKATDAI